jgi:hypothetical protein
LDTYKDSDPTSHVDADTDPHTISIKILLIEEGRRARTLYTPTVIQFEKFGRTDWRKLELFKE